MINFLFFLYIWILCCFMSLALHKIDAFPEFHFQYRFFFHFWETKNSGFLCTITALNLNTTGSSFVFKKRFSFNKQFFASHDNIYIKMSITEVILLDNYSYDLQSFIFVTHCHFTWFGFLFKQKDIVKELFTSLAVTFQFETFKF